MVLHSCNTKTTFVAVIYFSSSAFKLSVMQKNVDSNKLKEWISHFNQQELPFITSSALLELKDLEAFIASAKAQEADSVRIYFIRFKSNEIPTDAVWVNGKEATGCKWLNTPNGFTQASIAMIPTKNFQHDDDYVFSADNITINNQVTVLMPGIEGKGTAMNPPGTSGKGG